MNKQLVTILCLSVALLGCSKTESEDHAESSGDTTVATSSDAHATPAESAGTMEERMQTMNAEMVHHLGPADAEYDHRFIDMMIPHHEGAILMARDALQKSQRPEIRKLAEEIIAAQEKEIAQLKAWGEAWYHKH